MNFDLQINQERNGEVIDQDLVKSTVTIYVEMGIEPMNEILKHHCSRKVLHFTQRRTHKWIQNESYEDYMYLVLKIHLLFSI